eukprot:m.673059 g.673059  ORF g.673059 m.673059 type:complete len:62 (+) comp22777_c0_seq21:680-865(+)
MYRPMHSLTRASQHSISTCKIPSETFIDAASPCMQLSINALYDAVSTCAMHNNNHGAPVRC